MNAAALGDLLRRDSLHIACAESCTGGLLTAALTAVSGSSDYVNGGVVAYSNDIKERLLNVSSQILLENGAVSRECALAMARGVAATCRAEIGIGITGIAGPTGGTAEKPVGLIYVAGVLGDNEIVRELRGDFGRERNRARAVDAALELAAELIT